MKKLAPFSFFHCMVSLVILWLVLIEVSSTNPKGLRRRNEEQDIDEKHSDTTPPHKGCQLLLKANHDPQPKLVGQAYKDKLGSNTDYDPLLEGGATSAICVNGFAGGYPCQNVDLLSMIELADLNNSLSSRFILLNDIWGWTDSQSGREFAIIGTTAGTVFVEITDQYNPIHLGAVQGSTSPWRDVKVYQNYAFIVSEATGHGVQVFDLTRLLTAPPDTVFTLDALYNSHGNAHNVFINEDTAFLYSVGSDTCSGGLHIIDVNYPTSPTFVACYSNDGYTHDVQCVIYNGPDIEFTGKEICFASNEDTITIIDVTDKSNMVQLSKTFYTDDRYTHQGWLTDDHQYFLFGDELDEIEGIASRTRTHVVNVGSLKNPSYVGYHAGRTSAIDHNLYIKGNLVYEANYRAGLQILEIGDLANIELTEKGFFDVFAANDGADFNGAWSNYPYFPSGAIVVSGIEQGLFVLKYNPSPDNPSSCDINKKRLCRQTDGCFWYRQKCNECSKIPNLVGCTRAGCDYDFSSGTCS